MRTIDAVLDEVDLPDEVRRDLTAALDFERRRAFNATHAEARRLFEAKRETFAQALADAFVEHRAALDAVIAERDAARAERDLARAELAAIQESDNPAFAAAVARLRTLVRKPRLA